MIGDQTEFLFRLPNSDIRVKVKFNANVWECWVEANQDWKFGGEYPTFETAVERCMAQAYNWA